MAHARRNTELVDAPREIFIFALTILSLINIVLMLSFVGLSSSQRQVIFVIDGILTVFCLLYTSDAADE